MLITDMINNTLPYTAFRDEKYSGVKSLLSLWCIYISTPFKILFDEIKAFKPMTMSSIRLINYRTEHRYFNSQDSFMRFYDSMERD